MSEYNDLFASIDNFGYEDNGDIDARSFPTLLLGKPHSFDHVDVEWLIARPLHLCRLPLFSQLDC